MRKSNAKAVPRTCCDACSRASRASFIANRKSDSEGIRTDLFYSNLVLTDAKQDYEGGLTTPLEKEASLDGKAQPDLARPDDGQLHCFQANTREESSAPMTGCR